MIAVTQSTEGQHPGRKQVAPRLADTQSAGVAHSTSEFHSRGATVPLCTTRFARYIGRVGALAFALGIGVAVANSPGVAWASPNESDGSSTEKGSDATSNTKTSTERTSTTQAN